jgi:hypothetical protein
VAVERLPSAPPPPSAQPSRDVRSLQRAFFDAALSKVQGVQAGAPEPNVTPLKATPVPRPPAMNTDGRIPRPGSIIDIKI